MELKKVKIADIKPYEKNPRKNDDAVDKVIESIRQCEYISPIVVDENGVILAGHTRYKAMQRMGMDELEVVIKSGLTDEQKRKYRIFDNRVAEFSTWDMDLLESEIADLNFEGFDFEFSFSNRLDQQKHTSETHISTGDCIESDDEYDCEDYVEFDIENDKMAGMEDVTINISVPRKFANEIREYLRFGEPNTAPGLGRGVMKRCGLL